MHMMCTFAFETFGVVVLFLQLHHLTLAALATRFTASLAYTIQCNMILNSTHSEILAISKIRRRKPEKMQYHYYFDIIPDPHRVIPMEIPKHFGDAFPI
jgi:hypothetical protein